MSVTPLLRVGIRSANRATLTPVEELDVLIERAGRRGYLWHQFRVDHHGPEVLAGVFQWPDCADVVVLIDDHESHAYRTPTPINDVFAPSHVHWWYGRSAQVGMVWVLRALLTLPSPREPGGLPPLVPALPDTGVPGARLPVRLRRWFGR
jgi:hypothetical protein